MAALGDRLVTLADVAKDKAAKSIGKVAEVLVRENAMLEDIPYMQMNEGTIHKEEIRSSLPAIYYRKANQAIPPSKTTTEERSFSAAHFESKSQIDAMVARRGGAGMVAYNRWNQAQGHIQAHAIEHAALTIYGSPLDSHLKTPGFFDILSTVSASEATSAQIVDAGGTGSDNTSILIVTWGERSVFGVYPAGTQAGLKRTDRSPGDRLVQIQALDVNGNNGFFWGYEEDFEIDHGLVVKDYRQIARVANIDVSDLRAGSGDNLIQSLVQATYKIHNLEVGKTVIYMNRTVESFLDEQVTAAVSAGGGITFENFAGKRQMMFRGIRVKRSDALLNTESRVV